MIDRDIAEYEYRFGKIPEPRNTTEYKNRIKRNMRRERKLEHQEMLERHVWKVQFGGKYEKVFTRGNMTTVELEFVVKESTSHHDEIELYKTLNKMLGVKLKEDGSVMSTEGNRLGRYQELIVSFRDDNYARLSKILNLVADYLTVNRTCGMHVHLDARDMSHEDAYINFCRLCDNEYELSYLCPSYRRGRNWCKYGSHDSYENEDRYYAINWTSYDKYNTVEVRLGGGTLKENIVVGWCKLLNHVWDNEDIAHIKQVKDQKIMSWMKSRANQLHTTREIGLLE